MKIYIKYMVSRRCKLMVKAELAALGICHSIIELGEVELDDDLTEEQRELLHLALLKSGLELMEDKKAQLIEKIKTIIIEMIYNDEDVPKLTNSAFLEEKLAYDYTYLANIFSEVTATTVEHYIIAHKIERVKELLIYDELTLTQISHLLNYSSVAHLSFQFKKVTGLTASFFKGLKHKKRVPLEDV
ncbi:helix-turn-helix domain-containing protein [Dyadobacter fanqingshengii]|uniref:AraC family transcriptional regulator n=1 Tax=Dyadobacter fanqingshengii TaxID=2906443 RepID=A0A9X1PAT7_9BACT|nr:helix-turn-helix domain-containing protein [Dyadobacter fanqingshengii]MCF0041546.1 AraC family transcriptional regulator [Dyadobacter fanqingshengii]USJ36736.1 AraC family transcriptional regulator [Dyadobacter fanqingshengii]